MRRPSFLPIPILSCVASLAFGFTVGCSVGCSDAAGSSPAGMPPAEEQPLGDPTVGSSASEWLTRPVFDQAFSIVEAIDYLPFQYRVDGCYARSLYMAMELASEGIASNALFAFAASGYPLSVGGTDASYHVAPLLAVGPSASSLTWYVIDPSLASSPMSPDAWLSEMGRAATGGNDEPELLIVPGSRYAPGDARNESDWANRDVPDLGAMPSFHVSHIQDACRTMHDYLAVEPGMSAARIARKQAALTARSTTLIARLETRGKLVSDATFSAAACGQ